MSECNDSFSDGRFAVEADGREEDHRGVVTMRPEKMRSVTCDARLARLAGLASVDIETSLVTDLSGTLHSLFDPICDKTLPIYFGPLLGRLYLEGL